MCIEKILFENIPILSFANYISYYLFNPNMQKLINNSYICVRLLIFVYWTAIKNLYNITEIYAPNAVQLIFHGNQYF